MTTTTVVKTARYEVPVLDRGSGAPLVYLHSQEGPIDQASEFLQSLETGRRLIAPTHPGFAGTEADPEIADIHNVVVFYLELFDRLELDTIDLVGHALGAMFAAELAAVAPRRVRKLVLASPLGVWSEAHPTPDVLGSGGPALLRMAFADPTSPAAATVAQAPMIERTANIAMATNYLWPLPDRGLAARLHRLTMPTLLIRGDRDGVVSDGLLGDFAKRIPDSEERVIEGAGHFPMLEQPEAFSAVVSDFLSA